jgi:outer membrane protein, heavy metal efflux system
MKGIVMVRHVVVLILTVLLVSVQRLRAQEAEDIRFLVIEALTNNPSIAAEVYRMQVLEQEVPQAGALDDPQFTYKLMEFSGPLFRNAMYQNYELMQMIMFPTKLALKKDIASIRAEHAHHMHLEKVTEIIAQVKASHAMLWNARTMAEINRTNQQLLEQILNATQTRYAVGKTSQHDILKTTIELAKLRSQEASLHQEVVSAEAMLRALLNRHPSTPIGLVSMSDLTPIQHSPDDLISFAIQNRPMIVHDSLSIVESENMLSLMKQEYLPDFKISVERVTMPMTGMKSWTVMAGISVPIAPWTLSKASARVQQATAERSMRESMYRSSLNMVGATIREFFAKVKSLEAQIDEYETAIIPQARQSVYSLLGEYQTDRTTYIMLLDSYRMYHDMRMEASTLRMNYERERSSLERQVGVIDLNVVPINP